MNHTPATLTSQTVVAAVLLLVSSSSQALSCPPPTFDGYDFRGERIRFQVSRSDADAVVLKEADKATFEVIDYPKGLGAVGCAPPSKVYSRDASKMYYRGQPIVGADPDSWTFINSQYGQDKNGYYANGRRVLGNGFVMLVHNYAKTDREVFLNGLPLEGADAATFEVWHPSVRTTRDKRQVYFEGAPIPQADAASFEQVKGYLFKDKRAVYLEGRELEGLDPVKLRVSKYGTYKLDDKLVFSGHKRIERDASTFQELVPAWSKDRSGVYSFDRPVKDADVESFVGTSISTGYDKNYRFNGEGPYCKLNPQAEGTHPPCTK